MCDFQWAIDVLPFPLEKHGETNENIFFVFFSLGTKPGGSMEEKNNIFMPCDWKKYSLPFPCDTFKKSFLFNVQCVRYKKEKYYLYLRAIRATRKNKTKHFNCAMQKKKEEKMIFLDLFLKILFLFVLFFRASPEKQNGSRTTTKMSRVIEINEGIRQLN